MIWGLYATMSFNTDTSLYAKLKNPHQIHLCLDTQALMETHIMVGLLDNVWSVEQHLQFEYQILVHCMLMFSKV